MRCGAESEEKADLRADGAGTEGDWNMDAYEDFAEVYDTFMDETPYEEWAGFVAAALREAGILDGLVLDLGCGTGTMTELLAKSGYDMIGVDLSDRMLNIAMEKREKSGLDILYLQQDMREFELYGTVRAVICLCDSLNYLLKEEELLETFRLVNNYLDPGGLFLFDFNTVYKYETVIGDTVIAENRDECSFIWENYYDAAEGLNEYDLTVFVQKENDLFRKFTETHLQRGYTLPVVKSLVEKSGLLFKGAIDADTHGEVTRTSERIYVFAAESGKADTPQRRCLSGSASGEDGYPFRSGAKTCGGEYTSGTEWRRYT